MSTVLEFYVEYTCDGYSGKCEKTVSGQITTDFHVNKQSTQIMQEVDGIIQSTKKELDEKEWVTETDEHFCPECQVARSLVSGGTC